MILHSPSLLPVRHFHDLRILAASVLLLWLFSACAGGPDYRNDPGFWDQLRFDGILSDFQACAEEVIRDTVSRDPKTPPPVNAAMMACHGEFLRLYPAMEESRCCTPHYIEGYAQGSWGRIHRALRRRFPDEGALR